MFAGLFIFTCRKVNQSMQQEMRFFQHTGNLLRSIGMLKIRPVTIKAYRGFGSLDRVFIIGRILRERPILSRENDSRWKTLADNLHRFFFSKKVAKVKLKIELQGRIFHAVSTRKGYFRLYKKMDTPLASTGQHWLPYKVSLDTSAALSGISDTTGELLVPSRGQMGIITDIDDTIIQTQITSFLRLKMIYLTFMKNASKRKPIRQAAAFLKALETGRDPANPAYNPVFYVSKSPWNLYEILTEFLEINQMPKGPLFLRDFGIPFRRIPIAFKGFKYRKIKKILKAYPDMPFVLIGDSGEKDADIYIQLAKDFPNRIRAIYIRDVNSKLRTKRVQELIDASGLDYITLVKTYKQAAVHAAAIGLIDLEQFNVFKKNNKSKKHEP